MTPFTVFELTMEQNQLMEECAAPEPWPRGPAECVVVDWDGTYTIASDGWRLADGYTYFYCRPNPIQSGCWGRYLTADLPLAQVYWTRC
jgi:hypothetical protein